MTSCEDESLKYFILKNYFYFSVSFCLLSWFYNVYSFHSTFMLVLMIHRCFVHTKTKQNTIINNLSVKKESIIIFSILHKLFSLMIELKMEKGCIYGNVG